jgi:hypothetical protein
MRHCAEELKLFVLGLFVKFVFPLLLDVVDNDTVDRKDE